MKTCIWPKCASPARARGLCDTHYRKAKYYGILPPVQKRPARPCTVEGCDKPRKGRLYCGMHDERARRHGSPGVLKQRGPTPSQVGARD